MFGFLKKDKWRTVAIDTRFNWHYIKNPNITFDHVLVYQINDSTGERRLVYEDATEQGRLYAEKGNSSVAKARSRWIHGGMIFPPTPGNQNKVTYIDPTYAPLGSMQKYFDMMKKDPAVKDLLKEQMVDDALGQLEVAVKLTQKTEASQ